jgi:PX domain
VPSYKNVPEGNKMVAYYMINVKCEGKNWEVKRRYNEFVDLKKELSTNHGDLPPMPGKTLWKIKTDEEFSKRRLSLEQFL